MSKLNFCRSSQGSRSINKLHQRRVLMAALLLGILIILADWARRPGRQQGNVPAHSPQTTQNAIDNRLASVSPTTLPPDNFLAVSTPNSTGPQEKKGFFPGVRPELFSGIQDDTPSSSEEMLCCLHLLGILQKSDLAVLRKASEGRVSYAQLFRQPEYYRGRLVTVAGTVRRVHRLALPENQYGLTQYYQVWLFSYDNPGTPLVVYCLDLPKGFPTGMTLEEEAEATGFFFKRWVYPARDTLRTTPTLLAKTLEWRKPPPPLPKTSTVDDDRFIPVVIVVSLLLAIVSAWMIYVRTKPQRPELPQELPDFKRQALAPPAKVPGNEPQQ